MDVCLFVRILLLPKKESDENRAKILIGTTIRANRNFWLFNLL